MPEAVRHAARHADPPADAIRDTANTGAFPTSATAPQLLDVAAVAQMLSVHERTVRDLIRRGVLPCIEFPGVRRTLVDVRDVEKLIEASRR